MAFNPEFFDSKADDARTNQLLKYLQHQPPEVLAQVARSASDRVKEAISHNVQGLLGMLPSDRFNVHIATDRENLAHLLGSAMMTGYFLRQMEQRMELEDVYRGGATQETDGESF
jgi:23S rRNA G2069 N7-methylase RlmK/C1962 C5-methylase RlmI